GAPVDDAAVQGGLAYLRTKDLTQTYDVSLQTMALALARQPKDLLKIQANVPWLIKARVVDGGKLKGWSYDANRRDPDNSNTQYALLGLHEGHQAGAKVDSAIWESILDYYKDTQNRDGGWGYKIGAGSSRTMSTAGLCGLLIASNDMRSTRKEGVPDRCGDYDEDRHIAKALDFVGLTLLQNDIIERNDQTHYYIYGLERAGRLSGRRFIAGHDWYRVGCHFLVKAQAADGAWAGGGIDSKMVSTCFALLFLSKGRTPILITKLAYGSTRGDDWNNDRNDAKTLVDFASRAL